MTNLVPIGRALISVSDKTGLLELARDLAALGVELISTGGTSGMLRQAGLAVRDVADVTGFPEMMDGRVKTLHPMIHGGLLALRDDDEHLLAMAAHGIEPIDLLVVNLYPFEDTVAKGADTATCIENIDIGGPAMLRAAAKNFGGVAVDAQHLAGAQLVALRLFHDQFQHRAFDGQDHHVVDAAGSGAVQVAKVFLEAAGHRFVEGVRFGHATRLPR